MLIVTIEEHALLEQDVTVIKALQEVDVKVRLEIIHNFE